MGPRLAPKMLEEKILRLIKVTSNMFTVGSSSLKGNPSKGNVPCRVASIPSQS